MTQRLTIALNDEPQSLSVLPDLDDTNRDKFIILKAHPFDMPVDTGTPDGEENLQQLIKEEMPAFIHYMLNKYSIPDHMKGGGRFQITHYHNPSILELLGSETPEDTLLYLIDSVLGPLVYSKDNFPDKIDGNLWCGTAFQLQEKLSTAQPEAVRTLLRRVETCGQLLKYLSVRPNPRVKEGTTIRGYKRWEITILPLPPSGGGLRKYFDPAQDVQL